MVYNSEESRIWAHAKRLSLFAEGLLRQVGDPVMCITTEIIFQEEKEKEEEKENITV